MSDIEKYLNKVVDYMVKRSKNNQYPFDSVKYSFNTYCKKHFGLTNIEVDYVFFKYRYLMGWDGYDRSPQYLERVLNKWLMDNE